MRVELLLFPLDLSFVLMVLVRRSHAAADASSNTVGGKISSLDDLKYKVFPKRKSEESAVVEWGHSAIISALDAVVAEFGPQTSSKAFFEVETAPVLADPIDGRTGLDSSDDGDENPTRKLNNADEILGNMCVMTNAAGMSGVQMAKIAKDSGAVALMVVNTLESDPNPDYVYSLQCESDEECEYAEQNIDIPVIMVSLTSGNVLTTATAPPDQPADTAEDEQFGLPERVRLYAGGDRPFFEDVSHDKPVVYLIHNLLTDSECDQLINSAASKVESVDDTVPNVLEGSDRRDPKDLSGAVKNIERTYLWKGLLKSFDGKAIDERIEQVTGFPQDYFSDFQVNRHAAGARHGPHYDSLPGTSQSQMASIHVFLTDSSDGKGHSGGELVFPLADRPLKIMPKKGMAVVYHNTGEDGELDLSTIHAELALEDGVKWTAKKFVYTNPLAPSRRIVVPLLAYPFGGKAPSFVISIHNALVNKFGPDKGGLYFDKLMVVVPVAAIFGLSCLIGLVAKKKTSAVAPAASTKGKAKKTANKQPKRKKKDEKTE